MEMLQCTASLRGKWAMQLLQPRPRGQNEMGCECPLRSPGCKSRDNKRGTIGTPLFTLLELHLGKNPLLLQDFQHHLHLRAQVTLALW